MDAIIQVEQFHEAVLAIFDSLLWWATEKPDAPVDSLTEDEAFIAGVEQAQKTARELRRFRETCDCAEVRKAIESLSAFALAIERASTPRQILDEVLVRHHRVQSGKLDGGAPKRDWVSYHGAEKLLRPSPRFQRSERPPTPSGQWLTHPYRLEPFVFMLTENNALPPQKTAGSPTPIPP